MKKTKLQNILIGLFLVTLFIGFSYAIMEYAGEITATNQTITSNTANLSLTYTDCADTNKEDCANIVTELIPGGYITKTFQIENTGTATSYYSLVFSTLMNTFKNDELVYEIEDLDTGEIILPERPIPYYEEKTENVVALNNSIKAKKTQKYKMTIKFLKKETEQKENKNAVYELKLGIILNQNAIESNKTLAALNLKNQVKEEPTDYNMFNYTYNGYQRNIETGETEKTEGINTEGIYEIEDDYGVSYYFRGSNALNNIVQFGSYSEDQYYYTIQGDANFEIGSSIQQCEDCIFSSGSLEECLNESNDPETYCAEYFKYASAGDNMYWRIIRINGDGTLRLTYYGAGQNVNEVSKLNSFIGRSVFNNSSNDKKYIGYTYDNSTPNSGDGTDSTIKTYLENWYNENLYDKDSYIATSQFYNDTSNLKELETSALGDYKYTYTSLRNNFYYNGNEGNISPSLKTQLTTETYGGIYYLKIGLITLDELTLSGYDGFGGARGYDTNLLPYTYSLIGAPWTITPGPIAIKNNEPLVHGIISGSKTVFVGHNHLNMPIAISPVINLTTEAARSLIGNGSATNPYRLPE